MTTTSIVHWTRMGRYLAEPDVAVPRAVSPREDHIAEQLDSLTRHGYHVLHSIPVGARGCDIDHLVIGPGGVFTVNTKVSVAGLVSVAGYVMTVGGTQVPHLRNAKFEAERAAHLLGLHAGFVVPVRGCLVMLTDSRAPKVAYVRRPIGVSVLTKVDVPRWFDRQPTILSKYQVDTLFDVARRSITWS